MSILFLVFYFWHCTRLAVIYIYRRDIINDIIVSRAVTITLLASFIINIIIIIYYYSTFLTIINFVFFEMPINYVYRIYHVAPKCSCDNNSDDKSDTGCNCNISCWICFSRVHKLFKIIHLSWPSLSPHHFLPHPPSAPSSIRPPLLFIFCSLHQLILSMFSVASATFPSIFFLGW